MEKLAFFSSDSRDLYKEDIFRVLTLPVGYVIQFRYDKKWVDNNIDIHNIKGSSGIIFYSHILDKSVDKNNWQYAHHSIREAEIIKADYKEDTGLVLFFLKLKDYANFSIDSNVSEEKRPGKKFASMVNVTKAGNESWYQIVDKIKGDFGDYLYVNFSLSDKEGKNIYPDFDPSIDRSFYKLNTDASYIINLGYYSTAEENGLVTIEDVNDIIEIFPSKFMTTSKRDNTKFRLVTHNIKTDKKESIVNFLTYNSNEKLEFKNTLDFELARKFSHSLFFGFLTMLIVLATALLISIFKGEANLDNSLLLLALAVIVLFASAFLHWRYDKK